MSTRDFDFEQVFTDGEVTQSRYNRFPDPGTISSEEKIEIASGIFSSYYVEIGRQDLTEESKELIEIELDVFMQWIKLTDSELEKAQELAILTETQNANRTRELVDETLKEFFGDSWQSSDAIKEIYLHRYSYLIGLTIQRAQEAGIIQTTPQNTRQLKKDIIDETAPDIFGPLSNDPMERHGHKADIKPQQLGDTLSLLLGRAAKMKPYWEIKAVAEERFGPKVVAAAVDFRINRMPEILNSHGEFTGPSIGMEWEIFCNGVGVYGKAQQEALWEQSHRLAAQSQSNKEE